MDLYCQKCGEPWEFYYVMHELPAQQRKDFRAGKGCETCRWGADAPETRPLRAQLASLAADLLGEDIDGQAAELEDAEYLLGSDFWEE